MNCRDGVLSLCHLCNSIFQNILTTKDNDIDIEMLSFWKEALVVEVDALLFRKPLNYLYSVYSTVSEFNSCFTYLPATKY